MKNWQLKQKQSLRLEEKILMSQNRIRDWYEYWEGNVYISFSGGKDSTVLLHLVREIYPEVPAVFVDTGLEYPEIREFVKGFDNVVWLEPKKPFPDIIKKYGYPVVSKKVARMIRDLQNPTDNNKTVRNLYMTGITSKGHKSNSFKLPEKWKFLIDAPFMISEKCCDYMKKEPFKRYEKKTGNLPYIGTMAQDSQQRRASYLQTGCNNFNNKHSSPLAFWLERDIWEYLENIKYCKIYDMGESRTGCMFCMFGVHLENEPNRFQRMQKTHPKQYNYCMNYLGINNVLDFVGVPTRKQGMKKS